MKTALRILAGFVFLLLIAVGAAYVWRMPLTAWVAEGQLEKLGLTDPQVRISELTTSNITLSLSSTEVSGEGSVVYDLGTLLRERRVGDVNLARIKGTVRLTPGGRIQLEGLALPGGDTSSEKTVLPFESLRIGTAEIILLTPEGDGRLVGEAAFSEQAGGLFSFILTGDRLGLEGMTAEQLAAKVSGTLNSDGTGDLNGYLKGDYLTTETIIRQADLQYEGSVADWRSMIDGEVPEKGQFTIEVSSASIGTETTAMLQTIAEGAEPFEAELELVMLTGSLEAILANGIVTARIPRAPVEAKGATGSYLRLLPAADEPLLIWKENGAFASAILEVDVPQLAGMLTLSAEQQDKSPWRLDLSGEISRGTFGNMSLAAHRLDASGTYEDGLLSLKSNMGGRLGNLQLGALTITEAMLRAKLPILLDINTQTFSIPATEETSLVIGGAQLQSANGGVTADLGPTEILPEGGPLLLVQYGEESSISGGAGVRLSRLSAQAGETRVTAGQLRGGASLNFDNAENSTRLSVALSDGTVLVNDALRFTGVAVEGEVRVLTGKAEGQAQIGQIVVTEARDAPRVAPMRISGPAILSDGALSFDMSVETTTGSRLGQVRGRHVFDSGAGAAAIDSGDLRFSPGGLQPAELIPPLKGIVGTTTGTLNGTAEAVWGKGGVKTSAIISPQGLSFTGPGVAVERTENISGALTFSNLLPVTTDGTQQLSVGRIDFGSIALPDGTVEFALPGDETLVVEQALFPLFDGRLIAEDAKIGFGGGSTATLRVENIDLTTVLEFLDVEGLRGEGKIEGELPIVFEDFAIRIDNGELRATSPGSIQFVGDVANAAARSNPGARLAFDALENLRFTVLSATVNGRLDGDLDFTFNILGESEIDLDGEGAAEDVTAPIRLRTNIQMPLISLINQARLSFDARLQLEAAQEAANPPQE